MGNEAEAPVPTKGDGLVGSWPEGCAPPEQLADLARYAGSGEHKGRPLDPSFDFAAALRSDASRCSPDISRDQAQRILGEAIRRRCVSQEFDGCFPRYVWARLNGQPYVARLTNQEQGAYKGWPIEEIELPTDPDGLLQGYAWEVDQDA